MILTKRKFSIVLCLAIALGVSLGCNVAPSRYFIVFVFADPRNSNQLYIDGKPLSDYKAQLHVPAETYNYAPYWVVDGRSVPGLVEIVSSDGRTKFSGILKSGASIINLSEEHEVSYRDGTARVKDGQSGRLGVYFIHNSEPGTLNLIAVDFNKRLPAMKVKRDFFQKNRVIELVADQIQK